MDGGKFLIGLSLICAFKRVDVADSYSYRNSSQLRNYELYKILSIR